MNVQKGVFSTVNDVVHSAKAAAALYGRLSMRNREEIIKALRQGLRPFIDELAMRSFIETGMGKVADKKLKIQLAINETPGTEILESRVKHGDGGLTLFEYLPYGVACAIQPSTNPCETMINNTIGLLAAGNTVINCPHPRAMEVSKHLTHLINQIIVQTCGIDNMVVTMDSCMLSYIREIMTHPDVDLIVSTGGSESARCAISSGKKTISAGPGNPTFIVDETADIERAVHCIVKGATFDNNITCVSEKNIVLVDEVAPQFVEALEKHDVYYVSSIDEMLKISKLLLTEDMTPNKLYGGRCADDILRDAGISTDKHYELIAVDTVKIHPMVTHELLMPLITIVRVADFEEALDVAVCVERQYHHTAGIHSNRVDRMRRAASLLKTAVFIKNGCSLDGIGICGVGGTGFTIANITGEGVVTAEDFSKKRRCVLVDSPSMD